MAFQDKCHRKYNVNRPFDSVKKVYNKTHKCIGLTVTLILQNKTVPCNATEHATAKNVLLLPRPHSVWRHQPIPRLPTARRCRASFLYFNGGAIPLGGGAEKEKISRMLSMHPGKLQVTSHRGPRFPVGDVCSVPHTRGQAGRRLRVVQQVMHLCNIPLSNH